MWQHCKPAVTWEEKDDVTDLRCENVKHGRRQRTSEWRCVRESGVDHWTWCHLRLDCHWRTGPAVNMTAPDTHIHMLIKCRVLPYSLPSVGPGANPGVHAVSLQVTWSHPPVGRLPLLSARPMVTFPTEKRHRPSAGTKLYCLVTEAHACEQIVQGCYLEADQPRFEPASFWIASERHTGHHTYVHVEKSSTVSDWLFGVERLTSYRWNSIKICP